MGRVPTTGFEPARAFAHQILMASTAGDDPASLQANARLRRLPIPPRRDKRKIQDSFAMRPQRAEY